MLRCGEQYRRRYIERESPPPRTTMIRGSAVHLAIKHGLSFQKDTQEPARRALYEDVAATAIAHARHGGATLTAEEVSAGTAATWGHATDVAVACAGTYGDAVAPDLVPVAIERTIAVADVPGLPDITLVGTLDVATLETDDVDGVVEVIRDDKSTEYTPRASMAETSPQLTMYALLRSVESGSLVSRVALDHLVYSKSTKAARHVTQPARRTAADLHALVRRIAAADRAVQAGIFLPASPDDWWCSERWCAYWSDCPYAHGARPPQP
jgi:hypothetical protein